MYNPIQIDAPGITTSSISVVTQLTLTSVIVIFLRIISLSLSLPPNRRNLFKTLVINILTITVPTLLLEANSCWAVPVAHAVSVSSALRSGVFLWSPSRHSFPPPCVILDN